MKKAVIAATLTFAAISDIAYAKAPPPMTPMQLQALQSREFETSKENLFGALMTVLQDLGYQVQSADIQTGFITAVSATQNKTNFLEALAGASSSGNTKVTSFIQAMPSGLTRVRLNFLNTKIQSSGYGQSAQQDKPIFDAKVYSNAWERIDEALFVMGALQAPPKAASSPTPANAGTQPVPDNPAKPNP